MSPFYLDLGWVSHRARLVATGRICAALERRGYEIERVVWRHEGLWLACMVTMTRDGTVYGSTRLGVTARRIAHQFETTYGEDPHEL